MHQPGVLFLVFQDIDDGTHSTPPHLSRRRTTAVQERYRASTGLCHDWGARVSMVHSSYISQQQAILNKQTRGFQSGISPLKYDSPT